MDVLYDLLKFLHVMSFVFMTVPLFNLIIVNERALLGVSFNYYADRYMENIIKHGAYRCFVFQSTVLITGVLLLIFGPGIEVLWQNWIVLVKTVLLFTLMETIQSSPEMVSNNMPFPGHYIYYPGIASLRSL